MPKIKLAEISRGLFAILIMTIANTALAQERIGDGDGVGTSISSAGTTFSSLLIVLDSLIEAAIPYQSALVPTGLTLLGVGTMLTVFWGVYNFLIGDGIEEFVGDMVKTLLIASIPAALLIPNGGWNNVASSVERYFTKEVVGALVKAAPGRNTFSAESKPSEVINGSLQKISEVLATGTLMWSGIDGGIKRGIAINESIYEEGELKDGPLLNRGIGYVRRAGVALKDSAVNLVETAWGTMGSLITGPVMAVLMYIMLAILTFALIFTLYVPLVAIKVGIVFGPLLIAWLPFKPLSDLTVQWFKFMMAAGLSYAIGVFMLLLTSGTTRWLANEIERLLNEGSALSALFGGVILVSVLTYFIFKLLSTNDEMASALVGSASVGIKPRLPKTSPKPKPPPKDK